MEYSQKFKYRIWELDFIRGIALILMIYFHIVYDLKEFYSLPVIYESGINYYIGKISAILFMLVSGISSSLSSNNIKRGLKVLVYALIIAVISHLYNPVYGVKFGILHFLGLSMLLSPLFIKINKYILTLLGASIIFLGTLISKINTSVSFLFPLGIINSSFVSSDYYPLIPWFGVFLIGLSMGKFLYSEKRSRLPSHMEINMISKIGKNTLPVYLVHQPVILLVLILLDLLIA